METVDCCRMDGRAMRVMSESSVRSNRPVRAPSSFPSARRNTKNESTAEIPCAISVAQATPATPIWNLVTRITSSTTLNTDENMRK